MLQRSNLVGFLTPLPPSFFLPECHPQLAGERTSPGEREGNKGSPDLSFLHPPSFNLPSIAPYLIHTIYSPLFSHSLPFFSTLQSSSPIYLLPIKLTPPTNLPSPSPPSQPLPPYPPLRSPLSLLLPVPSTPLPPPLLNLILPPYFPPFTVLILQSFLPSCRTPLIFGGGFGTSLLGLNVAPPPSPLFYHTPSPTGGYFFCFLQPPACPLG